MLEKKKARHSGVVWTLLLGIALGVGATANAGTVAGKEEGSVSSDQTTALHGSADAEAILQGRAKPFDTSVFYPSPSKVAKDALDDLGRPQVIRAADTEIFLFAILATCGLGAVIAALVIPRGGKNHHHRRETSAGDADSAALGRRSRRRHRSHLETRQARSS
jgi:hypothetical protein